MKNGIKKYNVSSELISAKWILHLESVWSSP